MIQREFDKALIKTALAAARSSGPEDVPVGAVVASAEGEVLAAAGNSRVADQDPTAHAEITALRNAAGVAGSWRLDGCVLAVTLEPCPMCAGAAVNARLARIVYGAYNPDYGACGSVWEIPRDPRLHHRTEIVGGVSAAECGGLVSDWLAQHR